MADVASALERQLAQPVLDQTGLTGIYDFNLNLHAARGGGPTTRAQVMDAVRRQLGLRLEPVLIPVTVIVVDGIHKPTLDTGPLAQAAQPADQVAVR